MFVSSLKRHLKRVLLLILFFSTIMTIQTDATWKTSHEGEFYPYQSKYLADHDLTNQANFCNTLNVDYQQAYGLYNAINLFILYNGKVPDGEMDAEALSMMASGGTPYIDYDMAVWRRNMMNSPGKHSDSVSTDWMMLRNLSHRLHYVLNFNNLIENHMEIMSRAIRRGGSSTAQYETALKELSAIETEFPVTDTAFTAILLDYLNTDWYILAVLGLSFFAFFSAAAQQKITNQLLISKTGIRKYVAYQILAAFTITFFCMAIYYAAVLFACTSTGPGKIAWELPIQCVFGENFDTDYIYYDMKVWEYFLLMVGVKILYCMLFVNIICLLSALSRNNLISGLLAIALCGSLILLHGKWKWGGLLIGNGHILLQELCYFNANGTMIHYFAVYASGIALLIPAVTGLTVLLSKPAAKGWVK